MVEYYGYRRTDVPTEMLRLLTPNRPVMPERPLDPEERAAVERAYLDDLLAQARSQQRLQDIQTRRPGFQTLMGYGARQVNPISRARAGEAATQQAERQLESPFYRRFIEDRIIGAADVQPPAPISFRDLGYGSETSTPTAAPIAAAPTTAASSAPAAQPSVPAQAPSGVGSMYDEFNQAAPVYSGPPTPAARAVQVARQTAGAPLPPQRPDRFAAQPPSHEAAMVARGNAVRDAWVRYNETGNAADFVRASALMQANMPERQQEADGGAIKAKGAAKPDAIHKALEIIHHLLMRER